MMSTERQNSCLTGRIWTVYLRGAVEVEYDRKHESSQLVLDKSNERKRHGLHGQLKIEGVAVSSGDSLKSELCSCLLASLQSLDEICICELHNCMFTCEGR